jgi:hypothetical protein
MWVRFSGDGAAADDVDPLGGRVTPQALRSDLIRTVWLFTFVLELAHQTTAPHPEEEDLLTA